MTIAEKYAQQYQPNGEVSLADLIQAALDEQSETHALELRAYEATVQNLEQRIRQLEAQSVAAWKRVLSGKHGIEVYASNDNPGCFGFTGCESDDFESEYEAIQAALDEQAEAFKGELQAYDGMVRELTKTVEDMQAAQSVAVDSSETACTEADGCPTEKSVLQRFWREAQSVPVVGEPLGWRWVYASGEPEGVCIFTGQPSEGARRKAYERGCTPEFVIAKPTHFIPAAELASLRKDAERYRWLRDDAFKHSEDCFFEAGRLFAGHQGDSFDVAIDAALAQEGE